MNAAESSTIHYPKPTAIAVRWSAHRHPAVSFLSARRPSRV